MSLAKLHDKKAVALRRERIVRFLSVGFVLLTVIAVLANDRNLLVSVVLAFVVNYLLSPIVSLLERRGIPKQLAIWLPFVASGIGLGLAIYAVLPLVTSQFARLEQQLPKYQSDLMNMIATTEVRFKGFFKLYKINITDELNQWLIRMATEFSEVAPRVISGSLTVLILTPILAFFMLQDGRQATRSLIALVPNNFFEFALSLQHRLNDQIGGFIRARILESAIVGLVIWVLLQSCGIPYASLLALFAALTNLIPYVGPIVGAVPALLIALLSEEALALRSSNLNLALVSIVFVIAQLIDILFIIPLVVAKIVNLHPVTVIVAIIAGAQLMGIVGMVISIPVASAAKLVFQAVYQDLTEFRG